MNSSMSLFKDMDAFFSDIGLCRKVITKDDTSLFRAFSEKIYYTQCYHARLRDSCLDYLSRHISEYQPYFEECLEERIKNIRDHQIKAGNLEMIVLTRMYRMDYVLFRSPTVQPISVTNYYNKQIVLCSVEDNHFDLVYTKTYIEAAGICQSIIYEVLYKGVFGLDSELEEAVLFLDLQKQLPRDNCMTNSSLPDVVSLFGRDKFDTLQRVCERSCPPVPYRIAKALHPGLYRNVELDIVQEEKREARLRTLDACKGFSPGDKCQVVLEENEEHPYNAHIQLIDEQGGTVVVFVEELGVKKSVSVSALRPLPLQTPSLGDLQAALPVAEVDLLPFVKKGRRKKQHQLLSLLVSDGKNNTVASFCRGRSNSSSSSSHCHNISSSSDCSSSVNNTANTTSGSNSSSDSNTSTASSCSIYYPSNHPVLQSNNIITSTASCGSYCLNSHPVLHSGTTNNACSSSCISNNSGSRGGPSSVVPLVGPESYIYPFGEVGIPGSYYFNPSLDLNTNSYTFDPSLVPTFTYTPAAYDAYTPAAYDPHTPAAYDPHTPAAYDPQQGETNQLDPTHPYYTMSASSAPTHGQVCWVPVVAVPYASNMGQVNLGWSPSQDPYGQDLPLSDVNTLRYFFNLGVEFYRMSASSQPVNYSTSVVYSPHSSSEMNQPVAVVMDKYTNMAPLVCTETHNGTHTQDGNTITTYILGDSVKVFPQTGANFSINQAENYVKTVSDSSLANQEQMSSDNACNIFYYSKNAKSSDKNVENSSDSGVKTSDNVKERGNDDQIKDVKNGDQDKKINGNEDDDDDVSEGMDARSDGDSGCPSECADLSPVCGTGSSEILQSEGGDDSSEHPNSVDNPKPRGKRRYYMYGNHKLIKPIKEIPLRFQILLAETSAAKARCEGQPIYMQQQQQPQQPAYDYVYYPANESAQAQLNANATCFVPSQDSFSDANMAPAYIPECYPVNQVHGYPNTVPPNIPANSSPLQSTPLFVPSLLPPHCIPAHTATSQNCQTIIVYSSHSANSCVANSSPQPNQQICSVNMPPPQYPPPISLPPPPIDHMSTNCTPCLSPVASQIPRPLQANHSQPSASYTDQHMKSANPHSHALVSNKPSVILSVPPPNHTTTIQGPTCHQISTNHISNSVPPAPNPCRFPYSNPAFLPVPQPLASPSNMHAAHINGLPVQAPLSPQVGTSNSIGAPPHSIPYSGISANQYMYVYPSPPTGQSATPAHVVYMVSPAYPPTQNYQQPGVFAPPSCPVPVQ